MVHLEEEFGQELFQDKVIFGWEDYPEFEQEFLAPDSIERLSKDRRSDLVEGGVEGAKAELVIRDFVGYKWKKCLEG